MQRERVLSSKAVATMLGWSTKRARRWMESSGLGFKMGARYFTTPTKIRDAFPEVYAEILTELEGDDEDS